MSDRTLSIPATGEDRNGIAVIRVLLDGLAFQARRRIDTVSVSMRRHSHIHQTDFRTVDGGDFQATQRTQDDHGACEDTSTTTSLLQQLGAAGHCVRREGSSDLG